MKSLYVWALAAVFVSTAAVAAEERRPVNVQVEPPPGVEAPASVQSLAAREPLVTIRFNQRSVAFQRPLYGALSQALEVKPGVVFDLVSYVPPGGSRSADARNAQQAQQNLHAVSQAMMEMGVPQSRMTARMAPDPSAAFNEVRLFVR